MRRKRVISLSIEPLMALGSCNAYKFWLPNSVAVLSDGSIIVADGGNDCVHLLTSQGVGIKSIGGRGVGKYRFKEPVGVFVSPSDEIYVADWHNHRVVIYDRNLRYIDEFGHYGVHDSASNPGLWNTMTVLLSFIRQTASTGSYIPLHFPKDNRVVCHKARSDFRLLFTGLLYWTRRYPLLLGLFRDNQHALNKPNGIAFCKNNLLVVSEKNSRCLSFYINTPPYTLVKRCYGLDNGERFGRLGNVVSDIKRETIFVCDEHNHIIHHLDCAGKELGRIRGLDSGIGAFLPFSAYPLDNNLLCACGGFNFQIIDIDSNQVVYCSDRLGELHGVCVDTKRRRLYVADRSNSLIRAYEYLPTDNKNSAVSR